MTGNTAPITDLSPYHRNPREGDVGAISVSLQQLGQYRPIVVNKGSKTGRPNEIAAGNHTFKAAAALGWDEIDVTWIDVDDDTLARIVLVDNRTNDLASYDAHELTELLEELAATDDGLTATGYDGDALDELLADLYPKQTFEKLDGQYTRKVESPIYEPIGPKPSVSDLYDRTYTDQLITDIDTADLPDDLRAFLHAAAERHTAFRYDRIANYYAHAPAAIQKLMEDSALVIIDFDRAIELGFVRLNDEITALYQQDHA